MFFSCLVNMGLEARYSPSLFSITVSGALLSVYSGIPQMQGSSSQLQGFNPQLLRLHGEISLSLLCSHRSLGSALALAPTLCVGRPPVSVPHPDWRRLKQRLTGVLLFTQVGESEGYGSHNWNAGRACSGRGRRDIAPA